MKNSSNSVTKLNNKNFADKIGVKHWQLYLLILPAILVLIIFAYVPMYGVIIAFKNYTPMKGIWGSPWCGFDNFLLLFKSYYFKIMIKNTLSISLISLIVNTLLPIIFALMINEVTSMKLRKTFQTVSYAPYFVSLAVLVGMCFSFTSKNPIGIINKLIQLFGGEPIAMMFENKYFVPIYVISGLWQGLGWWSIIYVATLSSVDVELYEAAKIDGASRIRRIISINLPALKPTIITLFILAIGGTMNVGFEKVYLMQTAGNLEGSEVLASFAYKVSLGMNANKNYSFGVAVDLFNSVINIILLLTFNHISKVINKESLW